jgi:hypothetical protein
MFARGRFSFDQSLVLKGAGDDEKGNKILPVVSPGSTGAFLQ